VAVKLKRNEYASLAEVSESIGVSTTRLRALCAQDRIRGAIKGPTGAWLIPLPLRIYPSSRRPLKLSMLQA
jgi:hypothetical protein